MKKKLSLVAVVVALGILGSAIYGWSQATAPAAAPAGQVDVKAFRQFQKETLPFRDELMAKKMELRNEYAQPNPNLDRIGTLQKEMIDLRTKIQTAAQKYNVRGMGCCGWMGGNGGPGGKGCPGAGWGRGHGHGGPGMGPGAGMGRGGAGFGSPNCPFANQ